MICRSKSVRVGVLIMAVACQFPRAGLPANGQATSGGLGALPPPTGPFGVGRVTVHWTDTSRVEPLAADRAYRELMVDVWYPADSAAGPAAEYLDPSAFDKPQSAALLKGYL